MQGFFVSQRIIEWNAYCVKKMCQKRLPVLDVYWMAASYPDGPWDGVHYVPNVFESAVVRLYDILSSSNGSKRTRGIFLGINHFNFSDLFK